MDFAVREVAPQVWRVDIAGTVRIVRYRAGTITFAPWDICTAEGGRLWAAPSLESAFRWIEARAGLPSEVLLTEGLLNQVGSNRSLATAGSFFRSLGSRRTSAPPGVPHLEAGPVALPGSAQSRFARSAEGVMPVLRRNNLQK